jgi:hypothetical protein
MNIMHFQGHPDKPVAMGADDINQALTDMEEDPGLKTVPSLIKEDPSSMRIVSFREKHAAYLEAHPKVMPQSYLANLRTMIKIRI